MTAGRDGGPARILAVRCPDWPDEPADAAGAAGAAEPAARVFDQVVAAVEDFCPQVEVLRPGLCALAVRGAARYFGGEEALARKIAEAVTRRGFGCRTGIADGLFAACLAARSGDRNVVPPGRTREFLAPCPVHVLGSPDLAAQLARLGIRTLGNFAALPAQDVASRFGAEGAAAQRVARGLEARPLAVGPPRAGLSVADEFDPPAVQAEPVVFAAKGLAERMLAGLAARGLSCVRVRVEVTGEDGTQGARLWRHDGLLSALAVAQRVRWQLDGWRSGHEGTAARPDEDTEPRGITLLRLVPDQVVPDEGRQLGLWGDDLVSDRVERAAVRLQAMLGHEAVTHPMLAGGRGPAEQVVHVPFGDVRVPRLPADRPWPGRILLPAPATVYPDPVPARVSDASGAPVTVTGRGAVSGPPAALALGDGPRLEVTAWAGPWPVSERWWDERNATRRARFQLVTGDETAWLAAVERGRWQIEARYD